MYQTVYTKARQRGFTLVELMIALGILGLLVAVALPAYQQAIRKSNRADAQITLSQLATLQERYYFGNNQYTGDFADLVSGATSMAPVASDEGHYSVALAATATSWTMVATAVGDQAKDTECAKLTLTHLGAKTALDSSDTLSPDCW